jgi:methionyl-tRNA formyltransferase
VVRAVFWGSSDSVFSHRHFHALQDADCRVVGVVDVPPARRSSTNAARPHSESFVTVAQRQGIPVFEPASPNTPAFIEQMQRLSPDLFCAAGYMLLLKPPILGVPRVITANFHASLLPAYRGKHPVFWALRHGESWCGLTVHEMGPALDTGDIIFQVRVPVLESDSVSALYDRIMSESVPLVSRLVACVSAGSVPRTPQPAEGASYFGATAEKEFRLDWSMEAGVLARWINATPGQCFMDIGAYRLFFLDARVADPAGKTEPGTLTRMTQEYAEIATGNGGIRACRVRNSEGREMSTLDAFRLMGLAEGAPVHAAAKGGQ